MNVIVNILRFSSLAASAAVFGILLLLAFIFSVSMEDDAYLGFYRYDYLLFFALSIQFAMLYLKLESWAEAKVIALFHVMAMVMEIVLTNPLVGSWYYPQPSIFKIITVPLFAGFMYSAVGSFFSRGIRLFQVKFDALPSFAAMLSLAVLSYLNFMTKFVIYDFRYVLFIWSFLLFYKTRVYFNLGSYQVKSPMLLVLLILAVIIWIAENVSTFYQIWLYPTQIEAWHMVGLAKIGSWYLLLLLSLVLVLKILGERDCEGHWHIKH
ncbi:DUF817 family protein [Acinetobacter rudis]|uniref:Integral membrane protein n=1 Tax=Acinetobacter rudis CIP 110305 TaxID=421052 RepID=S3NKB6_9GAMM|nr:DUF817 family protein [Acinetobacter rudis]EPF74679.1 hypothetical protein F945_01446 [Acinetobacter rudis CIP 110305]